MALASVIGRLRSLIPTRRAERDGSTGPDRPPQLFEVLSTLSVAQFGCFPIDWEELKRREKEEQQTISDRPEH